MLCTAHLLIKTKVVLNPSIVSIDTGRVSQIRTQGSTVGHTDGRKHTEQKSVDLVELTACGFGKRNISSVMHIRDIIANFSHM